MGEPFLRFLDKLELKVMANFNEQLLRIVEDYRADGQPWPAKRDEIAEWAVANDRYEHPGHGSEPVRRKSYRAPWVLST